MKIVLFSVVILSFAALIFLMRNQQWSQSYSKRVKGLEASQVWKVWSDIDQWHVWQSDIEYAKLEGDFVEGSHFKLKPKGVSEVDIQLIQVETNKVFTDQTNFPLARMYGKHEFIQHGDELEVKTTMSVQGFLGFVWRKIVAEDIANGMPEQTDHLIRQVERSE